MITTPDCGFCVHYLGGQGQCKAFPEGIPAEILQGYKGHRQPYPGDHGIQFALRPGLPPTVVAALMEDAPEPLRKAS